jgi:hypothetical protein
VSALAAKDPKFRRIVKEIAMAVALLGVGYGIAKVWDVWKGNSFNSCIFFKDKSKEKLKVQEQLKIVAEPLKELIGFYK